MTDSRFDTPRSGLDAKLVNEIGSDIDVRALVRSNAVSPIAVVPAGTEYVVVVFPRGNKNNSLPLNKTPSTALKVGLPVATVMAAIDPPNASTPMTDTAIGISIVVRPGRLKACWSMTSSDSGSDTDVTRPP